MATAAERWEVQAARRPHVPDVVAGLLNNGSAAAVAKAAVREAVARGARVRFLQALREGLSPEERASADEAVFSAALRALREAPRVPVTFEVAEGDAGQVFVDRSVEASVLVIGRDPNREGGVAAYCLSHARCDVLTVQADH